MPDATGNVPFAELLRAVDTLFAAPRVQGARAHVDVIGDLLGFLARRMTELHAARQGEVAQFLAWLEEAADTSLDELSGKTALLEYWNAPDPEDVVLSTLQRNFPRRVVLDVRRPRAYGARNRDRERIVDGVRRSMETLRPILRRIELTDELIEQLTYRLYDLRPEEIALIERASGASPGAVEVPAARAGAVAERDD